MVTLRDDVRDVASVARELGQRGNFSVSHVRLHAARGFDAVIPPSAMSAVRSDPRNPMGSGGSSFAHPEPGTSISRATSRG